MQIARIRSQHTNRAAFGDRHTLVYRLYYYLHIHTHLIQIQNHIFDHQLTNPHWARVDGYGPFSLCVIHKEGLCPS
jgi:hypothetical protein